MGFSIVMKPARIFSNQQRRHTAAVVARVIHGET
jgi:hypothetical protein